MYRIAVVGSSNVQNYRWFETNMTQVYMSHYPNKVVLLTDDTHNPINRLVDEYADVNGLCREWSSEIEEDIPDVDECLIFMHRKDARVYDLMKECYIRRVPFKCIDATHV